MTSNLASQYLLEQTKDSKDKIDQLIKQSFKPEFINRIDEIITFNPLGFKVQVDIARKLLNELEVKLKSENIYITLGEDVQKYVIKKIGRASCRERVV